MGSLTDGAGPSDPHVNFQCGKFSNTVACVWFVASYCSLMNQKPSTSLFDAFSDFKLFSPGALIKMNANFKSKNGGGQL